MAHRKYFRMLQAIKVPTCNCKLARVRRRTPAVQRDYLQVGCLLRSSGTATSHSWQVHPRVGPHTTTDYSRFETNGFTADGMHFHSPQVVFFSWYWHCSYTLYSFGPDAEQGKNSNDHKDQ